MKKEQSEYVELKPFYVYELIDSLNNDVFYVGKGKGERALEHVKEAQSSSESSPKRDRIRKTYESGHDVIVKVIGRFDSEIEAFAVESTLIHWVYGINNLTNIASGHGVSSIREKGNDSISENIDIPKKVHSTNGEYSQEHRNNRDEYSIVAFMQDIKQYLERNSDLEFSDIDVSNARFTKIYFFFKGVRLVVGTGHTSSKTVWVDIESIDGKKQNRQKMRDICQQTRFEVHADGEYATLKSFEKRIGEPSIMLDAVLNVYNELKKAL